jgi:iron complex transport system ATP-binding protein
LSAPLLACEAVELSRGGRRLFERLTLAFPRGSSTALLGPNGVGKSTLIRLCAGLLAPDRGQLLLDGQPLAALDRRAIARRVAALLQSEPLEFPFTVEEVVQMGRIPHQDALGRQRPRDLEVVAQVLDECALGPLRHRTVHTLSGGEQRRVLLARALAQEPELLLLDEPTAALDLHHQVALSELLAQRQRRGLTLVVVLHDLSLATRSCDRAVLLSAGQPPVEGSPAEVLTPARLEVAYQVPVTVGRDPASGASYFLPRPRG